MVCNPDLKEDFPSQLQYGFVLNNLVQLLLISWESGVCSTVSFLLKHLSYW